MFFFSSSSALYVEKLLCKERESEWKIFFFDCINKETTTTTTITTKQLTHRSTLLPNMHMKLLALRIALVFLSLVRVMCMQQRLRLQRNEQVLHRERGRSSEVSTTK